MITFIITNITNCGGTERVVTSQINYLVQQGFNVEIISMTSIDGNLPFFNLDSTVKIHHLGIKSYEHGGLLDKWKGYVSSFLTFRKYLKTYETDIIIGTSRNTNILSIINKPVDTRIIGCEHFQYYNPSPAIRFLRNCFYKKLEKLIVLTNRDFNLYVKKGIRAVCIPNAVSFPLQEDMSSKSNIAIAVGRNSFEKNFSLLLRLWKQIGNDDWTLKIVGEGPLLEDNKALAKELCIENVEFIPFTKNIIDYYKEATIYLMTSRFEAFPMVLLEAKTCGCVCVSFDCETGPREIIQDNKDGYLIPMENHELFISRVKQLMDNPILCREMGKKALENSKLYSAEVILSKLKDIL